MTRAAVPAYTLTLILSAFLLFSVQPMFAKMILPLLGGSPSVWNLAMVFFQAMLLGGYAYAHATSKFLTIRNQAALHLCLLLGCLVFLPLGLPAGIEPGPNPALWQMGMMLTVVGAPFFIISASAPMLQRWFSGTDHKDAANPYFLYAASNIGSMAALLSYPVLVEPLMTLSGQSAAWTAGYMALLSLTALCAVVVWKHSKTVAATAPVAAKKPTNRLRLIWLALAFIPSSLLLGVTTFITTDLASAPLLWIVPLTLYLLTFIIVFARKPVLSNDMIFALFNAFFVLTLFMTLSGLFPRMAIHFILHLALFFTACLICHKKLADLRPAASHLTEYYMIMSLGGVLGGMFNALLAPVIFVVPFEYTLALCAVLFVRGTYLRPLDVSMAKTVAFIRNIRSVLIAGGIAMLVVVAWPHQTGLNMLMAGLLMVAGLMTLRSWPVAFAVIGSVMLILSSPAMDLVRKPVISIDRNFFGILRVSDTGTLVRNLYHGTTLHGSQLLDTEHKLLPTTYYHPTGPAGDVFNALDALPRGPQNIAVIGLGTGTLACYGRAGRHFDFYEIDPDVIRVAKDKSLFTYLSDCKSPYKTILGDGRLELAKMPDATYDAIIIDAFSSDNIPMHLLTLEAITLYMHKVKAGGVIAFNLSNRHLNLEKPIAAASRDTRVPVIIRQSRSEPVFKDSPLRSAPAFYAVMTTNPDILLAMQKDSRWTPAKGDKDFRTWTDHYANILAAFRKIAR